MSLQIVDALADMGWAVVPGFLPAEAVGALAADARQLLKAGGFRSAGVGARAHHAVRGEIRRDTIHWLEPPGTGAAQQACLADVVGRERNGGPALAAFQMATDSGAIIGPVIAGALVDRGSFGLAFAVTGAVTLVTVLPWLRARETHPVERGAG